MCVFNNLGLGNGGAHGLPLAELSSQQHGQKLRFQILSSYPPTPANILNLNIVVKPFWSSSRRRRKGPADDDESHHRVGRHGPLENGKTEGEVRE